MPEVFDSEIAEIYEIKRQKEIELRIEIYIRIDRRKEDVAMGEVSGFGIRNYLFSLFYSETHDFLHFFIVFEQCTVEELRCQYRMYRSWLTFHTDVRG